MVARAKKAPVEEAKSMTIQEYVDGRIANIEQQMAGMRAQYANLEAVLAELKVQREMMA